MFVGVLLKLEISMVHIDLFNRSMVAVFGSLIYYIRDIELSLRALALEFAANKSNRD